MIHVARRTQAPHILSGRTANAARRDAEHFFERPRADRGRKPYRFRDDILAKVAEPLRKLFRGKCAYCERRLEKGESFFVDRFRPPCDATQPGGPRSPDHYWWLAYEWNNLYPACGECHRYKATKFPVQQRALVGTYGGDLSAEKALLVDPCVDDAQTFFYFFPDGRVMASGKLDDEQRKRAVATIELLHLNRKELLKPRAKAMQEVAAACRSLEHRRRRLLAGTGAAMAHPVSRVRKALASWLPFGAARRQEARDVLQGFGSFGQQIVSLVPELASASERERLTDLRRRSRVRRPAYVKALTIHNFKAIRWLDLTFHIAQDRQDAPPAGWKVFLGENGTGKSSLLQALALALSGELETRHAVMNWDKLLRRPRGKRRRPSHGFVKVMLSSGDVIELRFNDKKGWFESGAEGARTSVRAYGPTRNLPNTRPPASWKAVEAMVRVMNLFDANSPMVSAEGWIAALPEARFKMVAKTVNKLLQLERANGLRLEKRKDADRRTEIVPVIDIGNSSNRLDELSDGYQSMVALAADIMAGLPNESTDFEKESGIVLIDELGNHLHPSWRMRVVGSLRRAFPRMQFIATTHEPLCLRGLTEGETVLLRADANGSVHAWTDLPSPADFRVDQLLTSDFFGLNSTVDPESEGVFNEYYALLALRKRRPAQQRRLTQLRVQLKGRRHFGDTMREDLMYSAIDRLIARHRLERALPASELTEEAVDEVSRIWNENV